MDKLSEFFYNHFLGTVIIAMGITFLVSVFPVIQLNENQILYLFATIVQSVSALYGMTLAGYTIYDNRLDKLIEKSDDPEGFQQIVERLREDCRKRFSRLGAIVLITVIVGIYQLVLGGRYFFQCHFFENFILNLTMTLFLISLIEIVMFITHVVNPKIIGLYGDRGQKELENELEVEEERGKIENVENNFERFFRIYNLIEAIIIRVTDELLETYPARMQIKNMKQRIDYLRNYRENLSGMLQEIDKIRQYRNYLAHGTKNTGVPDDMVKNVLDLYNNISKTLMRSDMYDVTVSKHMEFGELKSHEQELKLKKILRASYQGGHQTTFQVQFELSFENPKQCYDFLSEKECLKKILEKVKVVETPYEYPSSDNRFYPNIE